MPHDMTHSRPRPAPQIRHSHAVRRFLETVAERCSVARFGVLAGAPPSLLQQLPFNWEPLLKRPAAHDRPPTGFVLG